MPLSPASRGQQQPTPVALQKLHEAGAQALWALATEHGSCLVMVDRQLTFILRRVQPGDQSFFERSRPFPPSSLVLELDEGPSVAFVGRQSFIDYCQLMFG